MIRADTRPIVLALAPAGALWQVALVLGASAFLAVAARFEIPLPPVPVTGQTFAVLIVGATLGARLGGAGVVAYLAEGAFGLPVLAGAPRVSRVFPADRRLRRRLRCRGGDRRRSRGARLDAHCATRGRGDARGRAGDLRLRPHLARALPAAGRRVLEAGFYPFIVGDLYKIALAVAARPPITRLVTR